MTDAGQQLERELRRIISDCAATGTEILRQLALQKVLVWRRRSR
jgi:hypothetical protein